MPSFFDQLNRKLEIPSPPKRIISLVPSQTELLYDLGLRDEVKGITQYCIHPDKWLTSKTLVGGTKKLNFETIKSLKPDLIIGNKEENNKGEIEKLMELCPVWMSDINNLKDALNMITSIGALVGKQEKSVHLKLSIETGFQQLGPICSSVEGKKVAYFIWRKPYMVAGHSTFINDMLARCGFSNVFASALDRYPEVTSQEISDAQPAVILLSSEPFPFKEKHIQELKGILPNAKIKIIDGELFSWYGSRILQSPAYFLKLKDELN